MDEMIPADGDAVPVAHHDNHVQARIVSLDPRRERQGAAVRRVQGIGDQVVVGLAGASDPRDHDRVAVLIVELLERAEHGP